MEEIDVENLINDMTKAASIELKSIWKSVSEDLTGGIKKLAEEIKNIQRWKAENKITEERAKDHIEMQKNAIMSIFLSKQGIEVIKVEKAINAALDGISNSVNKVIGWKLL